MSLCLAAKRRKRGGERYAHGVSLQQMSDQLHSELPQSQTKVVPGFSCVICLWHCWHNQLVYPSRSLVGIPVITKHLYNICTMLVQRRRRWADIGQMFYKCFVFAGYGPAITQPWSIVYSMINYAFCASKACTIYSTSCKDATYLVMGKPMCSALVQHSAGR